MRSSGLRFGDLAYKGRQEGEKERYTRIEIALDVARSDEELMINGDMIAIATCSGAASTTYFKLNHRHSRPIRPNEILELEAPNGFNRIYMSNAAEAGKVLIMYVSGALWLRPAGGKVGIRDVTGTDITPVNDSRFKAHTFGSLKPTTQTTTNVRQALLANTKVRWAIINFLSKTALIGTSTVTRGGGADDGQKYVENTYLALEHVDLGDVYIMNYTVG